MGIIIAMILASCGFIGYQLQNKTPTISCDALAQKIGVEAMAQDLSALSAQAFPVPGTEAVIGILVLGNTSTGKIEVHAIVPELLSVAADGLEENDGFQRVGECVAENGAVMTHLQKKANVLVAPPGKGI